MTVIVKLAATFDSGKWTTTADELLRVGKEILASVPQFSKPTIRILTVAENGGSYSDVAFEIAESV